MPTVAELDVKIGADDDATKTIMALDALIKGLDKEDVDIDVTTDADKARAEIIRLIAELRRLDQADPDIDVTTDAAAARAEIARLMAEIRRLDSEDADIDIDIDMGAALAQIAILQARLNAIRDETIEIRTRIDSDSIRRASVNMGKLSQAATNASRQTSAVAAAVLGLGTALIPIGAVGVGAIMGLVSALTVAGIGTAAFGAVAFTVFSGTRDALTSLKSAQDEYNKAVTDEERDAALKKMKTIMDQLDPATRKMVQSVLDFKTAWRGFAEQFKPQVFQIAQEGLAGLTSLLPSLAPIVDGAAKAFLSLERSAIKALAGPWWQQWLAMIGTNMQPLMEGVGRSIGNLVTGFAALIQAFMPMTLDFTGGMERMTGSFANWAKGLETNQGFQNFVTYIREQTPAILALIGSIALAFVAIVKAGAPLGEALVEIATNMFLAMAAFQQAHPAAATLGLALIGLLAVTLKLLGPMLAIGRVLLILLSGFMSLVTPITALAGLLGIGVAAFLALVAVIALVVAAFIYAYTHFEGFRNLVDTVASAVADFAVKVYNGIVTWLGQAAAWLAATFGPAIQAVIDFVVEQFNRVMDWVRENQALFADAWDNFSNIVSTAMNIMGDIISVALDVIQGIWNAVWPALHATIMIVWDLIKGVVSGALTVIMGVIQAFMGLLAGDWDAFWQGLVMIAQGFWTIIAAVFTAAFEVLKGIVQAATGAINSMLLAFWNMVVSGVTAAWNTVVSIIQAAWNGIIAGVKAFAAGVQAILNAFWSAVIAIFQAALAAVIAGLTAAWNTARTVTTAVWNAIMAFLQAVWNTIVTVVMAFLRNLLQGIQTTWNMIKSAISTAMSAIQSLISAAWSAILSIIASVMSSILSKVSSTWSSIRSAIADAISSIKSVVSSGFSAIMATIRAWGEQAISFVLGLGERFFSAGASIMKSLARGITSGISDAVGAVKGAIGQMTDLIPNSPARKGPMSGRGYPLYGGRVIAESLAQGVNDRAGLVQSAMDGLISSGNFGLDSLQTGLGSSNKGLVSAGGAGGTVSINIAPGAIVLQVGDGVSPGEARQAFNGAASSLAEELLMAMRRQ